ncbi:MAG: Maf family nucleotide pyrophosphatase [Gammaproteobacteria bacterium]|nr:Maf family nucleotide pyrophosphatase [Gammaproteobacteria bacterium]MDH5177604.1 Maf family nucleotide pyrophosphatase [Gammaproteobacteria bacterium]MDH5226992.1 Maf family nucleotide pyrophosphatase [Gammaproteobacteria bacterium]
MFSKGLILASTSPYRRALLGRLGLPFECVAPGADETRLPGEAADAMAGRLARLKAEAVASRYPGAVVIGSDQVALRGTDVLGKPGTVECCREQLRASSGREVVFLTAVHLIDGPVGTAESHMDRTVVRFRALSDAEIDRYIERDQPLDCAGGFKAESLGIALFDSIASNDPTGLTGLPLAWVGAALRRAGFAVP